MAHIIGKGHYSTVVGDYRCIVIESAYIFYVANLIVELIAEGPNGRTGDDVQVWAGHPTVLPPIGLEGRLTLSDLVGKN